MQLKELKKGEMFTLKKLAEPTEHQVYVRGNYDASTKKYECQHWDDIFSNGRLLSGTIEVFTDFMF